MQRQTLDWADIEAALLGTARRDVASDDSNILSDEELEEIDYDDIPILSRPDYPIRKESRQLPEPSSKREAVCYDKDDVVLNTESARAEPEPASARDERRLTPTPQIDDTAVNEFDFGFNKDPSHPPHFSPTTPPPIDPPSSLSLSKSTTPSNTTPRSTYSLFPRPSPRGASLPQAKGSPSRDRPAQVTRESSNETVTAGISSRDPVLGSSSLKKQIRSEETPGKKQTEGSLTQTAPRATAPSVIPIQTAGEGNVPKRRRNKWGFLKKSRSSTKVAAMSSSGDAPEVRPSSPREDPMVDALRRTAIEDRPGLEQASGDASAAEEGGREAGGRRPSQAVVRRGRGLVGLPTSSKNPGARRNKLRGRKGPSKAPVALQGDEYGGDVSGSVGSQEGTESSDSAPLRTTTAPVAVESGSTRRTRARAERRSEERSRMRDSLKRKLREIWAPHASLAEVWGGSRTFNLPAPAGGPRREIFEVFHREDGWGREQVVLVYERKWRNREVAHAATLGCFLGEVTSPLLKSSVEGGEGFDAFLRSAALLIQDLGLLEVLAHEFCSCGDHPSERRIMLLMQAWIDGQPESTLVWDSDAYYRMFDRAEKIGGDVAEMSRRIFWRTTSLQAEEIKHTQLLIRSDEGRKYGVEAANQAESAETIESHVGWIFELGVDQLAQYIAAVDLCLFKEACRPQALLDRFRGEEKGERTWLEKRTELLAHWVQFECTLAETSSLRAKLMRHFLALARKLMSYGDLEAASSMMQVLLGEKMSSAYFPKTWRTLEGQGFSDSLWSVKYEVDDECNKIPDRLEGVLVPIWSGRNGLLERYLSRGKDATLPTQRRRLDSDRTAVTPVTRNPGSTSTNPTSIPTATATTNTSASASASTPRRSSVSRPSTTTTTTTSSSTPTITSGHPTPAPSTPAPRPSVTFPYRPIREDYPTSHGADKLYSIRRYMAIAQLLTDPRIASLKPEKSHTFGTMSRASYVLQIYQPTSFILTTPLRNADIQDHVPNTALAVADINPLLDRMSKHVERAFLRAWEVKLPKNLVPAESTGEEGPEPMPRQQAVLEFLARRADECPLE